MAGDRPTAGCSPRNTVPQLLRFFWICHRINQKCSGGSVIVLDNASFHQSQPTRRLVEHAGCQLLYLPPCSPDLNPIEKLWANLKRRWRKIGGALDEIIQTSNYLKD
jgi:hypothetical protein